MPFFEFYCGYLGYFKNIRNSYFLIAMAVPNIEIRVSGRKILVRMPKNEADIQLIRAKRAADPQPGAAETGITKHVMVHTLRHIPIVIGTTHLLENGTDLRYIQSLLGHSSSKTTEVYTHITTKGFNQIASPLDKLDI